MRWLRETGMVQRTQRRWIEEKPTCESSAADFASVGLPEILPLFIFYAYGLLLSATLGIGEIMVHPKGSTRKYFAMRKKRKMQVKGNDIRKNNNKNYPAFWEYVN